MKNKFKLNETKDTLIIDDKYRRFIFLLRFVLISHVIIALIYIYISNFTLTEGVTQVYTVTGTICLLALIWFPFIRSTKNEILLSEIKYLKIRNIIGGQRYSIRLKNGKRRDINLDAKQYFNDFENLKLLISKNNIPLHS